MEPGNGTPPIGPNAPTPPPPQEPLILAQIIQDPNGEIILVSQLPGPRVLELLIDILPSTWHALKQQIREKDKIVKPGAGIVNRIKSLHPRR